MANEPPIPHHPSWQVVSLGRITLKIGSGATPLGGEAAYLPKRTHFALVRSQNVFDHYFDRTGLAFISDDQAERLKGVFLQAGDLLLNITGDGITFARCCLVPNNVLPACVNQHVAIIRVDPAVADPGFLLSYLTHPSVKAYVESFNAGGSRRAITKGHIESFQIPLPPLPEQHAIAYVLGTLDDKIELNRRMSETLEDMARALFNSWFVDFHPVRAKAEGRDTGLPRALADLFPDSLDLSDKQEHPTGWTLETLPEVIDVNPPRTLGRGEKSPYLDMANMPTRGHSADEIIDRPFSSGMRFMNGDTLVARITPCLENGKTAYVDFLKDGQVGWGSTEYIVLRPKPPLPEEFAYCLARSEHFREFAIQSMTGTSGRQRVPVDSLNHFVIASPPERIAAAFRESVRPLFLKARAAVEQSRTLAQMRDALLPKLISGELRIKDAQRIVGSEN
jgi:type I restriction enzyme S subunit